MGLTADAERVAWWVTDACERALQLVADLDDGQLVGPLLPTVNPLIWEIAHLAWFQEKFVLRNALGAAPVLAEGDALYDSGAVPHDTRWRLTLPSREQTIGYMRTVADRVAHAVRAPGATDVVCHFARYSVHHYDVHAEALTYTRQALGYPFPALPGLTGAGPPVGAGAGALTGDVEVPGGRFLLGARMADPFVYDNEKWAHPVEVGPFAIARAAVTQAEVAAFVDAVGYADSRLWSDGGAWLAGAGAEHPLYWRRGPGGGWQRRLFHTWGDLEPYLPVSHGCWWGADADCRGAGRRLPSEAAWEVAATGGSWPKPVYPWGGRAPAARPAARDWRSARPVDVA